MAARYILRLDDIAPNMSWEAFARLREVTDACGVRPLIGVIPDNRDPELTTFPPCPGDFWEEMRGLQGQSWGIAMHGYQHLYETGDAGLLGRSPKSEFAGLPPERQREKIRQGKTILEERGLAVDCFMAPSHSFDDHTLAALDAEGVRWVTDGLALWPFRWKGLNFLPQIVSTPRTFPLGMHTICIHLNTISERKMDRLLRFVQAHAGSFLTFAEASRKVSRLPGNRLLGGLLRRAVEARRGS